MTLARWGRAHERATLFLFSSKAIGVPVKILGVVPAK
jgi:hypothetical protein